jgi:hypothetical protein
MKVVPFALAVGLAGCAMTNPPADPAELKAAWARVGDCVWTAAPRMDDGVSDARTIGVQVASRCAPQYRLAVAMMSQHQNEEVQYMFRREIRGKDVDLATGVVLRTRAGARAPNDPQGK